jgi:uncharacterized protein YwqG
MGKTSSVRLRTAAQANSIYILCKVRRIQTMESFDKFEKMIALNKNLLAQLKLPALHISQSGATYDFCKFGGPPTVPQEFEWPTWNGKSLAFLLQLRLSDINKDGYLPYLPTSGLLYVFYDEEEQPWGFDPKDKGSWRVMFFEETDVLKTRRYPKDLETRYKERYVGARQIVTYPPEEDSRLAELIGDDEEAESNYHDLRISVYGGELCHHLGGYADPIQSADMDLECQLVSNGLYCGDETGYKHKRAKELGKARDEWILLLEIDSDDEVEMMWGDCGSLYFWIRKSDLAAKNFDNVWMILQCY